MRGRRKSGWNRCSPMFPSHRLGLFPPPPTPRWGREFPNIIFHSPPARSPAARLRSPPVPADPIDGLILLIYYPLLKARFYQMMF